VAVSTLPIGSESAGLSFARPPSQTGLPAKDSLPLFMPLRIYQAFLVPSRRRKLSRVHLSYLLGWLGKLFIEKKGRKQIK
jgi:hypothetical protein